MAFPAWGGLTSSILKCLSAIEHRISRIKPEDCPWSLLDPNAHKNVVKVLIDKEPVTTRLALRRHWFMKTLENIPL